VGLRLGLPICEPHRCKCGGTVDSKGLQVLSCKACTTGTSSRHYMCNDIISRALKQAGIANVLEPSHLLRSDNKRPDGVTILPWANGKNLVWDFSCRDSYAASYRSRALRAPGEVAAFGEYQKSVTYAELESQYNFVPFIVETSGVWGKAAVEFTKRLSELLWRHTGDKRSGDHFKERISLEIQRGNVRSVEETMSTVCVWEELTYM